MQADKMDAFLEYVNGEIEKMDWESVKQVSLSSLKKVGTWERKPAPMWDIASGIAFCRQLEAAFDGEWHVSLGGSVMYRGYSDKDLDVSLRAHDCSGYYATVGMTMRALGWTLAPHGHDYTEHPDPSNRQLVIQIWVKDDRRVDLFITLPSTPPGVIDVPGVIPF